MAPRKSTPRRRWTPRTVHGAFDAYESRLDSFDLDSELGELDELLGDPLDQVVMAIARPPRPIRASRDELRSQLLTRTWCARADDCGAGGTRRERGVDYLVHGAVLDLQVGSRRLAATVQGNRRYRVDVAISLPRQADMQATLARVQQARAAAVAGPQRRLAIERAILGGGPGLFPGAAQIHGECTCPDSPSCKHVVAAVYAFGVLLDREPEQLLSLWDLDTSEPAAVAAFVLPPLAADRRPLVDDLAIFGIDLIDLADLSDFDGPREPTLVPGVVAESPPPTADEPPLASVSPPGPSPALAATPLAATPLATTPLAATPPAPAEPSPPPLTTPPPSQQSEVRRDYLRFIGIPPRTIDAWLRSGVLRRTDRAGIYERTPEASAKIADFLAQ